MRTSPVTQDDTAGNRYAARLSGGPTGVKLGTGKSLFPCLIPSFRTRFRNPQAILSVTASSGRHCPAVDDVFGARNGGGARRSQKGDKIGHFFGFGWTTEWYSAESVRDYLLPTFIIR